MNKKTILIVAGVIIVLLIIWQLSSNKKAIDQNSKPADKTNVSIPVKVAAAEIKAMKMDIRKTGSIIPFKESSVLATTAGTIESISLELGQTVQRGQVLATLDHNASSLDLEKAETNVAKLKEDVKTYTELLQGKATTEQKVKDLTLQYTDAISQANQVRKKISDTQIKAPINGMIAAKKVEQGAFATVGMEIATIVDITKMKVQVNLGEREVYQVTMGQAVKITSDVFQDHEFSGVVTFISPQADEVHNYVAEIGLDNDPRFLLRSGTFVTVYFPTPAPQNFLVIPQEALVGGSENALAYVVNAGLARLRKIQTGRELNGMIEITGGLQAGDQIVVSGQINLTDSTRVRVSK